MSDHKHDDVRPRTAVLTRGFDPALSVGSARPAVFRTSTYVFSIPEAAERAFNVVSGREQAEPEERVDLIYARFNHPNAEILEDQIVPLEAGATAAAVFNSGMAAIMTSILTFARPGSTVVYTVPLYGGTQHLIHEFLEPFGIRGLPVCAGRGDELDAAIANAENPSIVLIETPANPTMMMTDIRRAAKAAAGLANPPLVMVDNTFLGLAFQHPLKQGADIVLYSATKYLSGFSDMLAGAAIGAREDLVVKIRARRGMFGNILRRVLDAGQPLAYRLPAYESRQQERAAHRGAARQPSQSQAGLLSDAVPG
jgi:methionine-gamma-lyase